tara:strand:+ start:54 stop:269 length:216 start_codon:yes stop_codon:yes gene_type:complete
LSDQYEYLKKQYDLATHMERETKWSAQILLSSNRLTKVEFISPSNLREDAEQTCKALYGVSDVRQLTRLWN